MEVRLPLSHGVDVYDPLVKVITPNTVSYFYYSYVQRNGNRELTTSILSSSFPTS